MAACLFTIANFAHSCDQIKEALWWYQPSSGIRGWRKWPSSYDCIKIQSKRKNKLTYTVHKLRRQMLSMYSQNTLVGIHKSWIPSKPFLLIVTRVPQILQKILLEKTISMQMQTKLQLRNVRNFTQAPVLTLIDWIPKTLKAVRNLFLNR